VVLAAGFASIGRVRASVLVATFGTNADAVDAGAAPVDGVQVAQPVEDHLVQRCPDTERLPLAQAAPAVAGGRLETVKTAILAPGRLR
jgi:hypothetical protein